ncbi:MAG: aminopeptidase N [Mycobacteriales bacterium]
MRNLTRVEARARAATIDVASYDVQLDLTGGAAAHFGSQVTVRFAAAPGAHTFAELDGELLEATLNGEPVGPLDGNRLTLPDLRADNELSVRARCAYSRTGEGLHRFVDPADGEVYLCAQSFLDDAQRIFACFDQPDLKAVFRLTVDAPAAWTVIGNARAEPASRGPADRRWTFAPTERISTYLFTVAAGPWHSVRANYGVVGHDGIELGLHCRRSLAVHLDTDAAELFELTGQCLDFQQEAFGRRYPFGDSYDQLFVPEFNAGAMENPGAVTFHEDFVFRSRVTDDRRRRRAMVIAHEMSHMWFGDLVTMRWWDDLWLNESFAELMGFFTVDRATRHHDTWVDFSTSRKAWGYRADQLPSTHPVQGDVADNRSALLNFDGISYAKGASVLRQLMATVGEETFFQAVRAYLDRYAFSNTTFADLLAELETASARELGEWARAWLQTSGVSTLRTVVGDAVQLRQEGGRRPHRIGVGLYDLDGEALRLRSRLDVEVDGTETTLALDARDRPDLLLPNDGDLTFAKLRFDERSLATVLTDLRRLDHPLARALCWASLWDACRDAELPAAVFVEAVLAGVDGESDPSVMETLLTQARTAALLYAADGSVLLDALAEASWQAAWVAPVGSDLQLVRVRAFAGVAHDAEQPVRLEALLDGTDVPPGLVVDTDLRWVLIEALAALGQPDEASIVAKGDRDPTAAGRLHALTARAARPDPAAKAAAWAAATTDLTLSNHESEAVAAGIWQPGQDTLMREYVDNYVVDLPVLWASRTPQVAGALAQGLFPSTLIDPAVLDRTAGLLDEAHPAGLRRYVAEQRADLARALRARQAEGLR